jgi:hypothetical protein
MDTLYTVKKFYGYQEKLIDDFLNGEVVKILCENGSWLKVSEKFGNSFDASKNTYVNPRDVSTMDKDLYDYINVEANRTKTTKTYKLTKSFDGFRDPNVDYLSKFLKNKGSNEEEKSTTPP